MNKHDEMEVLLGKVIYEGLRQSVRMIAFRIFLIAFFAIMYMGATYNWGG